MQLVIGDIHACAVELEELVDIAGLGPDDEIIAVGDIIDRGPDNQTVLNFFRTRPHAASIMGNHERKHLKAARGEVKPAPSQLITRLQLDEDYPSCLNFLEALPRSLTSPDALIVHAFWEPGVPLDHQRNNVLIGTLSGENYLAKKYDRPWYELYDGPKPLIVGHHDYRRDGQPMVFQDRVYAIDTGCCHGSRLTGILLPSFRFVSVPARTDWWSEIQRRYSARI